MRKYTDSEIKEKVEIACGMLLKNDSFLLEHDVNERSISHKLADYLQQLFTDYNVDCEYSESNDIVIHRRNTNDNLVVIEAKNSSNTSQKERDYDHIKLKAYLSEGDEYQYRIAAFIEYPVKSRKAEFKIEYYKNEDEINLVSDYYGKV
jgi:phenylacetate-coenzyme A ligase PaaK-like adenylate-forming protein